MEQKYWVPALERAHSVLQSIAEQQSKLRLTDLKAITGINKSTMFSLLHTMESLGWIVKEKGDTYALGAAFAYLGRAYFSGINIVELFMQKSTSSVESIGETLQLARLEGTHIFYLAKKEALTPVRLLSDPGMRVPAYATAMGKMLLSFLPEEEIRHLYQGETLEVYTPHTIYKVEDLLQELTIIRNQRYSLDDEEFVAGFTCVAVPICNRNGEAIAAISFTMTTANWMQKKDKAIKEIISLARVLSESL